MQYIRNVRRNAIAKRVIVSWVFIALVFFMIGGACGYALKTHITVRYEQKESTLTTEPHNDKNNYMKGVADGSGKEF